MYLCISNVFLEFGVIMGKSLKIRRNAQALAWWHLDTAMWYVGGAWGLKVWHLAVDFLLHLACRDAWTPYFYLGWRPSAPLLSCFLPWLVKWRLGIGLQCLGSRLCIGILFSPFLFSFLLDSCQHHLFLLLFAPFASLHPIYKTAPNYTSKRHV